MLNKWPFLSEADCDGWRVLYFLDIYRTRPILWWEFGECLAIPAQPAASHHSILQTYHHHSSQHPVTQIYDLDILSSSPVETLWSCRINTTSDPITIFYLRKRRIFSLSQIFPGMFCHVSFRSLYRGHFLISLLFCSNNMMFYVDSWSGLSPSVTLDCITMTTSINHLS